MTKDNRISDNPLLVAALDYIARGYAVLQLHDVASGRCSCGKSDCGKSAGKHPLHAAWQQSANLVRTPDAAIAAWTARPQANIGIATGEPSLLWALDVDGRTGEESLCALIEQYGHLPTTLANRTGTGGRHLLFAWDPAVDIRNSTSRLGPGLDIRGTGGLVVAPPSVSWAGPYVIESDRPELAGAPFWLVDKVCTRPPNADLTLPSLSSAPSAYSGTAGHREQMYAARGVRQICDDLAKVGEGSRNEAAFKAACRLHEFINAGWIDADEVIARYESACAMADSSGASRFPASEAGQCWRHAQAAVAGKLAVMPDEREEYRGLGGEMLPFGATAPSPGDADPFADPGSGGSGSLPVASSAAVGESVGAAQALRARMLTAAQRRGLPRPKPLVTGLLNLNTIAWLIGKPGSYKSFLALDLAAHVARGENWQGRTVRQGPVVYVAAEGGGGLSLRLDAWERTYGPIGDDLLTLAEPVQALDVRAWSVLVEVCADVKPSLVVLDTQARLTVGAEENSAKDMGAFIAAVDAVRQVTGACVLAVHHIGRAGSDARGSSVIDGAQDTELRTEKLPGMRMRVHVDKQKDQVEAEPADLSLRVVDGGVDQETGCDLSSLAVTPDSIVRVATGPARVDPGSRPRALYKLMAEQYSTGEGASRAEIQAAFKTVLEQMPTGGGQWSTRTLGMAAKRAFDDLITKGLIMRQDSRERFRILVLEDQSEDGILTVNSGTDAPDGWQVYRPDHADA